MNKRTLVAVGLSAISLAAILLTEPMYNSSLYNWSLDKIPTVQTRNAEVFSLWELYSTGGLVVACAAPVVYSLYKTTTERARAVYYTMVLGAIFLVMTISKLSYAQARPFWVSSDIEAGSCSSQFGNPSGHSLTAMGMALAVWLDYNQMALDGKIYASTWKRLLWLLVAVAFGVSIGWSRFVLGAHTMN